MTGGCKLYMMHPYFDIIGVDPSREYWVEIEEDAQERLAYEVILKYAIRYVATMMI